MTSKKPPSSHRASSGGKPPAAPGKDRMAASGTGENTAGKSKAGESKAAGNKDGRHNRPAGSRQRPGRGHAQPAGRSPWRAVTDPDLLLNRLLYRDGLILIVDKPAGLPVHAGPGGGPNVEQYLDALRFGLPGLPALAHRLDRDTSGCLVLGRHHKALRKLGFLFSGGAVDKTYWAIVEGRPPESSGTIDLPLRKLNEQKGWRMIAAADGQPAITDYRLLGGTDSLSWLELKPRTGRTHQIRVHCAEIGCPLLGDPAYGANAARHRAGNVPLHLLARAVSLPLYPKREPISAVAAPPPHMLAALRQCGYDPADTAASPPLPADQRA